MQIHDTAFIAPGAVVLGDVTIGENSGIWSEATGTPLSSAERAIFRTMR